MIQLQRIALAWDNNCRLELEAPSARAGNPLDEPLSLDAFQGATVAVNSDVNFTVPLAFEADPEGLYEPLRLRENTDYDLYITLPGSRADAVRRRADSANPSWPFTNPRLASVLQIYPPRLWEESHTGALPTITVAGRLNFASFVGTVDLSLDDRCRLRAEVACSKLSYFDDFKALLADISEQLIELLFEVDNASGYRFSGADADNVEPSILLFHLRRLMAPDALPLAIETILHRPHSTLAVTTNLVHPSRAMRIDLTQLVIKAPRLPYSERGPIAELFSGLSPSVVPERRKRDQLDTQENRYVKAFLDDLSAICFRLIESLGRARKFASQREALHWKEIVDEWASWEGWHEVGELTHIPSNSQVLLRRSGYREVLEAALTLQYGLRLPWERGMEIADAVGDLRPIFELYEYWCFFILRRILRQLCGAEIGSPNNPIVPRDGRLHFELRRGKTSAVKFAYAGATQFAEVWLFYNRRFVRPSSGAEYQDGSYSTRFDPDFSVLIVCGRQRHWLHFDAKYRLDLDRWRRQVDEPSIEGVERELFVVTDASPSANETRLKSEEPGDLYHKEDLYKMHTYRDAILGSRGAYVLFPSPATEESLFVAHRSSTYRSQFHIPSIGAFPLRPNAEGTQQHRLMSFLAETLAALTDPNRDYSEEQGVKAATP